MFTTIVKKKKNEFFVISELFNVWGLIRLVFIYPLNLCLVFSSYEVVSVFSSSEVVSVSSSSKVFSLLDPKFPNSNFAIVESDILIVNILIIKMNQGYNNTHNQSHMNNNSVYQQAHYNTNQYSRPPQQFNINPNQNQNQHPHNARKSQLTNISNNNTDELLRIEECLRSDGQYVRCCYCGYVGMTESIQSFNILNCLCSILPCCWSTFQICRGKDLNCYDCIHKCGNGTCGRELHRYKAC